MHAVRLEPRAIRVAPLRAWSRGAHVADVGATFHQEARDQQLRAFVAAHRNAAANRRRREGGFDGGQEPIPGGVHLPLGNPGGVADRLQPCIRAFVSDRRRAHHAASRALELTNTRGVERMNRGDRRAVQGRIQLTPLARRDDRAGREPERFKHHADADRVRGEHLTQERDRGLLGLAAARRSDRTEFRFRSGVLEHRAGQHVLGLGVRRHAESRHVDADDAHAVDLLWEQLERYAAGGRHAEVRDHDGVVVRRVGELVHRLADILEQLAGDQSLGVEGDVSHGASRPVEMRGEGQAVHAAGRSAEDGRGAPHAESHPQGAEGRAHRLGLIVRPLGVVLGVLVQCVTLPRGLRRRVQLGGAGVAPPAVGPDRECRVLTENGKGRGRHVQTAAS